MKYNIEVNGRGAEAFIFKISKEQYEFFSENGIEEDELDHETIYENLGVECYSETDDVLTGLYNGKNHGEHVLITVTDEDGQVVWESEEDFDFEEVEDHYEYNDSDYLLVEDYQKGNFFNYTLETDEDFNPELLSCKIVELLDGRSELITDIRYDGQLMEKDYGDTSSKGYTYILS